MQITKNKIKFEVTDCNEHISFWNQYNKWESQIFNIFNLFLNEYSIYIDIGSWIGPTVLYASQLCKHCYAIEPDPYAVKILKENIELNKFENITLWEGAIADSNKMVYLHSPGELFGKSLTAICEKKRETCTLSTQGKTFDTFIRNNNITKCNFIKIDIEGAEGIVLPTMKKYLEKYKPTLFITLHTKALSAQQLVNSALIVACNYTYLYDWNGTLITVSDILSKIGIRDFSIVATNTKWPVKMKNKK